jgi:hypothetical protein
MGGFATSTWARKADLLPPVGKDWAIELRLLANGKMPGPITMSNTVTELWMMIGKQLYWVDVQHRGKRDSIAVSSKGVRYHYNDMKLPPPKLHAFGAWMAAFENKIGKTFHRDKIWVRSNVKGGRDAVVAWIQNGYSF